ncbi:MAG: SDR family oxidoreductase, partial [Caulobacteraceae bacterium]|nr:SDR family oxidoreductase [Caulobacteraceae bacterium]
TALITGSTKGIGRAIAEQFVLHGASVTVTGRDLGEAQAAAEAINAQAGREAAWGYAFDFTKLDEVNALVDAAIARWGKLDTVIGNAYVTAIGNEASLDPAVYADVLRVNVVNNAGLAVRALPALKASGDGAVVFIGSASGLAPSPSVAAYGVSKRALLHMMQNLALEWGQYGVRVNAVVPGLTRTEGAQAYTGDLSDPARLDRIATWPLHRVGEPEEIAAACVFMCSPGGRFTTGAILVSDGGRTLTANVAGGRHIKAPD